MSRLLISSFDIICVTSSLNNFIVDDMPDVVIIFILQTQRIEKVKSGSGSIFFSLHGDSNRDGGSFRRTRSLISGRQPTVGRGRLVMMLRTPTRRERPDCAVAVTGCA